MEDLIAVVNELHDTLSQLGMPVALDLPQIAVVGGQSDGKSSVLETIVGKDFLPRGSGIVTRCPLLLKLHQLPASRKEEYGEFQHLQGKRITDFAEIRNEISRRTVELAGDKGITTQPINLSVYSPHVLNLTLIDLPGLVSNVTRDQPRDIVDRIHAMVMQHITAKNTIILAVCAANQDIANSAGIKAAQNVDPDGVRTLGVLTKLDLMDHGTDAMDTLEGRVIHLRRGFIGVKNRSQKDINNSIPMDEARENESKFFREHASYSRVCNRMGTTYLAKTLNTLLLAHIQNQLPELKGRVDDLLGKARKQQEKLGMFEVAPQDPRSHLLNLIQKYSTALNNTVQGRVIDGQTRSELVGGSRIAHVFFDRYAMYVTGIQPQHELSPDHIRTCIRNVHGLQPGIFPSDEVPRALIRSLIHKLQEPSLKCVQYIHDELSKIIEYCAADLERFPKLRERLLELTNDHLFACKQPCVSHVKTFIRMEEGYINMRHPHMEEALIQASMIGFQQMTDSAVGAAAQQAPGAAGQPGQPQQQPGAGARPATTPGQNPGPALDRTKTNPHQQQPPALHQQQGQQTFASMVMQQQQPQMSHFESIPGQIALHGDLSEREKRDHHAIRTVVLAYFSIVQRTCSDQVPKMVSLLLIDKLLTEIQTLLTTTLLQLSQEDVVELMSESSEIAHQRKALEKMLKCLFSAQETLGKIREKRLVAN